MVCRDSLRGVAIEGRAHLSDDADDLWQVGLGIFERYTLITCHAQRGTSGIDDAGVLGRFRGSRCTTPGRPMTPTPTSSTGCAHALRELAGVADTATPDADCCWATQPADALVTLQKLVTQAIATDAGMLDADALAEQVGLYRSAVQIGINQTSARTSETMRKHNALARRLRDRHDDCLRFTRDWRILPDNNGSERDIRMIKLRQKAAGCLRTLTGAKQFCAIRSYLSTAAKHGEHFFDILVTLAEGRPWLPVLQ